MPIRVPVYDEPQVTQRALPTVRQNAADFTGQAEQLGDLAQGMARAGAAAAGIADKMQDREDADVLFRTQAAAASEYQSSFETPARERRGFKAVGLANEAGQWWDKAGTKYAESLTNPRQRRLFSQWATQLRAQSVDSMSTYESGQRRASLVESINAGVVADVNLAAANPGNEQILSSARDGIRKKVQILADINGYDEVTRAAKEGEALTQLHANVLQSLVDSNPAAARAYFDKNKGEIDGAKHAEIEKTLKVGSLRTLAQSAADGYVTAGLTEAEAIARARKDHSGDEEEAVVAEVKVRFSEREEARNSQERQDADRAWKLYADGGYQRSAIPNSLWSQLDGRTQIAIDADYAERLAGKGAVTDWNTYDDLRALARDKPQVFLKTDLRRFYPQLGKSERETLTDLKDQIAKGDDVATLEQQISTGYKLLGLGDGDREKKGQFDVAVRAAIQAEQKDGKRLSYDERQAVIDRMILGRNWSRQRFYQVAGTEEEASFEPDTDARITSPLQIPPIERQKIEAALTRKGRPADPAEVVRLYKLKHGLP